MLVQVQSKLIVILQRWMQVRIYRQNLLHDNIISVSYASERSNSPPSKIRPTDFHFHAIIQLSNKCNFSRPSMDRFSFQTKIEKFYQRYPRDRIINTTAVFLRKFRRRKKTFSSYCTLQMMPPELVLCTKLIPGCESHAAYWFLKQEAHYNLLLDYLQNSIVNRIYITQLNWCS